MQKRIPKVIPDRFAAQPPRPLSGAKSLRSILATPLCRSLFFQARRRAAPRAQEPKGPKGPKAPQRGPRAPSAPFGGMGPWGPLGLFRSHSAWKAISNGGFFRKKSRGQPWARNNSKWYQNCSFGASGWPWARNDPNWYQTCHLEYLGSLGPERIQNCTKTDHLEHLGGLGSKSVQNDIKTDHLEHLNGLGPEMIQNGTKFTPTWTEISSTNPLNDTLRGS